MSVTYPRTPLLTQPLLLKCGLWLLYQRGIALYSQAWILFWNFPLGFSILPGLCSHSVHGQLWILFILGLHPNGPSPCLAKSSTMLWTEKIPIRNDKHETQIKPILHPGGSRYYWQLWYIGVCSGRPKRQFVKSTPKQSSNEGQKKVNVASPHPQLSWEISGLGEVCESCGMERKHQTINQQTWQRIHCEPQDLHPKKYKR